MAYRLLPPGEGGLNYLFRQYKKSARKRNYEWALSLEEFARVVVGVCVFCGDERTQRAGQGRGRFLYTGIDRWVNEIGYRPSNIVPCCGTCNKMKSSLDGDDFIAWAKRIANKARA